MTDAAWLRYAMERDADTARHYLRRVRESMNEGRQASGHVEYQLEQLIAEASELLERIKKNEPR